MTTTQSNPTTITADIPAATDLGENWAELATEAWITEAVAAGLVAAENQTPDGVDYSTYVGRVVIDGVDYDLIADPAAGLVRCDQADA